MTRSWDLIVVGSGSAGAVIAARCAQRGRRVLLLEAGPNYRSAEMHELWRSTNPLRPLLQAPDLHELVWQGMTVRWTEAQDERFLWRGRGVGGSSAINGQGAIRPPREDFDDWAAAGCDGWSWEEVLPYFRRMETDLDFGREPYHGSDGPIPISRTPRGQWESVDEALAQATLAHGFGWTEDINAPGAIGASYFPFNARNARRVTTNDGYLEPARALENLTIRGGSLVDRVIIRDGSAIGVEIVRDGGRYCEYAEEIVVSAGTFHSPAILIRSGIGPAQAVADLGLDVVADLPVGQGLQEHPYLNIGLPLRREAAAKSPDGRFSNCYVRLASEEADGRPADLILRSLNNVGVDVLTEAVDSPSAAPMVQKLKNFFAGAEGASAAGTVAVSLSYCYSRGAVSVVSLDPEVHPVIRERMLSDERDLRRLRSGTRVLAELASHDAFRDICAIPVIDANRGLWDTLDDDRKLDQYLLANVSDALQASCTCRMGPSDSPTSVVDSDLRVLGIDGLRVADASVFPSLPRAPTNLATITVGELAADRITAY